MPSHVTASHDSPQPLKAAHRTAETLRHDSAEQETGQTGQASGHGGAQADPASPRKRAGKAKPVRSGGSRAASGGVPRRPEERPGGRIAPLELRFRLGEAAGGRRLPVGGRVRGAGAHAVPQLSGRRASEAARERTVVRHSEREHPPNPGEIRFGAAGHRENARKAIRAEEETDEYHRLLPGEEEAGGHAP